MSRLESQAEKLLREAIERGEFDNVEGKGKPLDLREDPFEDPDLRTVHRLLRNAGFAPAWIEEQKDIARQLEAARLKLSRAWKLFGKEDRTNADWRRNVTEFREIVQELNDRIRIYNLKSPSPTVHRVVINADRVIAEIENNE
jgi:DnaJ homolog subfamily C member 28